MGRNVHHVPYKYTSFIFYNNFGKDRPISIFSSLLQSLINCGERRYKIDHSSLSLLLHYFAKFKCSIIHLYSNYSVQKFYKTYY